MIGSDLDRLLTKQRELMHLLGIDHLSGTLTINDKPSISEMGAAIGITVEAAEILEAMDKANRVWKINQEPTVNQVKEELIDVLFFVLELSVLLDLSGEDLIRLYQEKYNRNLERLARAKSKEA